MSITKTRKQELITEFKTTDVDNGGSAAAQVAVLTERIRNLTEHMKNNHKDKHSRRGLLLMVNRRKKLLAYIKKNSVSEYDDLIKKLGLRKKKNRPFGRFFIVMHNGKKSARGWARVARTLLSLRVQRSNPVSNARTRMRATLLFTGSPRSRCSLAMNPSM